VVYISVDGFDNMASKGPNEQENPEYEYLKHTKKYVLGHGQTAGII
jgi:hypothetical protein